MSAIETQLASAEETEKCPSRSDERVELCDSLQGLSNQSPPVSFILISILLEIICLSRSEVLYELIISWEDEKKIIKMK